MVLGFNHNIQYKGEVFHIQTEDSGVETPHIITLLYRGGTIISSKKTSYADIIRMDNLDKVVEELMKDQHKDMLRRLKSGEFDERAFGRTSSLPREDAEEGETSSPPLPEAPEDSSDAASDCAPKKQQSLDEIILDYLVAGETE
jgi:ketol-acid reductoisomerase